MWQKEKYPKVTKAIINAATAASSHVTASTVDDSVRKVLRRKANFFLYNVYVCVVLLLSLSLTSSFASLSL